ncbi:MAG: DUF5808 domain-containing protein [Micromonosporaceae bacterium]|jgi:hypothetical protein|nr:DUF5808 domain-containing protein [Natronosporangium sp.]
MVRNVARAVAAAAGALLAAAVARELSRPADQRTWHGSVAGVPYDLRPPTVEKIRRAFWNPDDPRLFTPHVFGVGWSVNLARLVEMLRPPTPDEPVRPAAPDEPAASSDADASDAPSNAPDSSDEPSAAPGPSGGPSTPPHSSDGPPPGDGRADAA